MRKFGTDTPEFMTFTLGNSKKVYKLPLAASMPISVAVQFSEIAAISDEDMQNAASSKLQLDILRRYIGDAADDLTAAQVAEIFEAWAEESNKQGATPGE